MVLQEEAVVDPLLICSVVVCRQTCKGVECLQTCRGEACLRICREVECRLAPAVLLQEECHHKIDHQDRVDHLQATSLHLANLELAIFSATTTHWEEEGERRNEILFL